MKAPIILDISGLYYHYKPDMPRHMDGYIKAEPDNQHDPDAIGIFNDDFGLIGYIPRDKTGFVRTWASADSPYFKCEINLDVDADWGRYFGTVCIYDKDDKSYYDNPFKDKNVYLCKGRPLMSGARYIVEGFGLKVCDRLSKTTDVVIYETEINDSVKSKMGVEGYDFIVLQLSEFIQKAIPPSKRNPEIYGRVVTPSSFCGSYADDYLRRYIITEGGIYRQSYNKKETEIVVAKSGHADKTLEKAVNDGKQVISVQNLAPELSCLVGETESDESNANNVNSNNHDCQIIVTIPQSQNEQAANRDNSTNKKGHKGCLWVIIIAFGLLIVKSFIN